LNREINPVFLSQLVAESETGSIYPNFGSDATLEIKVFLLSLKILAICDESQ